MSYAAIRDGLLAVLRDAEGFDADNVLYGDHQMLNAGVSRAAVVKFEAMAAERDAFQGIYNYRWSFTIRLFAPFVSDVPAMRTAQDDIRDAVLTQLRKYPQLESAAGVTDAIVQSVTPEAEQHQVGGASWVSEALAFVVDEEVDANELE